MNNNINNTKPDVQQLFTAPQGNVEEAMRYPGYNADHQSSPEENMEYYHEYMRLYIANVVLTNQVIKLYEYLYIKLKELLNEKNELLNKLQKLEVQQLNCLDFQKNHQEPNGTVDDSGEERKKRIRRAAQDIERHFKCPIENCQKQYGAEGSLNQHIKLKHPELIKERGLTFKSSEQGDPLKDESI